MAVQGKVTRSRTSRRPAKPGRVNKTVKSVKNVVKRSAPVGRKKARPQARKRRPAARAKRQLNLSLTPRMLNSMAVFAGLLVVLGAVLWVVAWINNPENLSIKRVDWQSEFNYLDKPELQALIEPHVHTNLYLLNEVALEKDLEEHPWIRAVSLRKAWPDELFVNIEEQVPIAFWGKEQLVNQFGEIFDADLPEKTGVFPTLYSPQGSGREMAERFVSLTRSLQGLGLKITELMESDSGSWRIKLEQGQEVIIGRKEQQKRLERFKVGYMQALRPNFDAIRTIDLRYTNGFAVEWKQGSPGAVSALGFPRQRLGS